MSESTMLLFGIIVMCTVFVLGVLCVILYESVKQKSEKNDEGIIQHEYLPVTMRKVNDPDAEHRDYWFDPETDWFTATVPRHDFEKITTDHCQTSSDMQNPILILRNQLTETGKQAFLLDNDTTATQCYYFMSQGIFVTADDIENSDSIGISW